MAYEQNECVSHWNGVWSLRLCIATYLFATLLRHSAKEFSQPSTSGKDFFIKAITASNENTIHSMEGMMSLFRDSFALL